jgi:DNA-binding winged helix-turn-helix (wHTH) protein
MTDQSISHFYDFVPFRLDAVERLLLRDGKVVRLTPKAFEILLLLARNSRRVLSKDELIKAVWPDSFVEESNLARNISTLRKALGNDHYIETVPGRGYRFAASVRESGAEDAAPQPANPSATGLTIIRSLAVLPFQPLSAEECDACLGLRLADAVITRLSGFGRLIVRPTSAVRKYADPEQDPVVVGGELKVDAVLTGSIQQSGKRIRVTAQLLNVRDGLPFWGAQFDAQFTDIFAVEDSLSTQVISALRSQLTGEERSLGARLGHY